MGKQYIRPIAQIEWGKAHRIGSSDPLLDATASSYMQYENNSGSAVVFPEISEPSNPIIAVGIWYEQSHGGFLTLYNGWVEAHLRYDNVREPASRSYVQNGYPLYTHKTVHGPVVYRPGMQPWTAAEINRITADVASATGPIAPNRNNRWCQCNGVQLVLYTADPVPVPTAISPAAGHNSITSSVSFSGTLNGVQVAQPVRAVFQVARDTGFTSDVRTFVGTLHAPASEGGSVVSEYTSVVGTDTWTDLGPGQWYLRVKGRDFLGNESAWSTRTSFTITNAPLPVPALSSVPMSSPYDERTATIRQGAAMNPFPGGVLIGIRWQFSQSSTFSTGVVEWLNLDGRFSPGTIAYDPTPRAIEPGKNGYEVSYQDPSQYLAQGTWYVRARSEDKYGQSSGWSGTYERVVSHPPASHPSRPVGGGYFDPAAAMIQWDFVDPWGNDRQSAYQVQVQDASSNLVHDSGWVTSSLTSASVPVPSGLLGTTVKWRVRTQDRDQVAGPWSAFQSFVYVLAPAVLVTYPTDTDPVDTGQPLISWDVAFYPGSSQYGYQVLVLDRETRGLVYDSGFVIDNVATSHLVSGVYLENMVNYEVVVRVTDSKDLTGEHILPFSTNFVLPPTITATASAALYDAEGYVRVMWEGAVDPLFESWRIYRRNIDGGDWVLAAEVRTSGAREARDWSVAESGRYEYAVVQVVSRYGALVEGSREMPSQPLRVTSTNYWLVVPELDMGLRVIPSSDSFSREREQQTMDIIGRGRKVNYGGTVHREGALTIPVRHQNRGMTASDLVDQIDLIVTGITGVYLRDPFGNYFPVALGRYSFERMAGVGATEMGDIEVPYVEVFA